MSDTWTRTVQSSLDWESGTSKIAAITAGYTLLTIHFGWGFVASTSQSADLLEIAQNIQVFGLCTTVGDGSESVPDPRTAPGNANPPTQRWLWWEARAPRPAVYSATADLVLWHDTPRPEVSHSKGMVAAANIPAGDTLNLWASWAAADAWDASGEAQVWYWASVGIRPTT